MKVRWRSAGRKSRFLFAIGFTFLLADWRLRAQEPLSIAEKMEWFRHDKFGMFIHWGPYSQLAGEWKGSRFRSGREAEWIMQRFNIPVNEYREMARGLNPVHFNAEDWVQLAKATGHEVPGDHRQASRRLRHVPVAGERSTTSPTGRRSSAIR